MHARLLKVTLLLNFGSIPAVGATFFFLRTLLRIFRYEIIEFRTCLPNDRTQILRHCSTKNRPRFSAPASSISMILFLIYYTNRKSLILAQSTHVKHPPEFFF